MIRLTVPSIGPEELAAVSKVLSGGFLVQGPRVAEFEGLLRKVTGTEHVVAVSNGTAALHLALLALGVGPGDLVLVTSYSWISTANVVELCGAQPVFVDINRESYNMCVEALAERLEALMSNRETARRIKAILPVDAFGLMAEMDEICRLAARHGIPVVEDAACALGAALHAKPAGSFGAMGTFSLHPRKAITTGEGGAIATNDADLAWKLRVLRNHGLDPAAEFSDFVMPGFNYRLTEFQAALGISQLARLDDMIGRRRKLAANYDRLLAGSRITPPRAGAGHAPVYQSYVCLLPNTAAAHRPALISSLKQRGIETNLGTWHMPLTTYFRTRYGYRHGDFPAADDIFARALALPLHDGLTEDQQATVVAELRKVLGD